MRKYNDSDLEIDRNNLEEEWEKQAGLYLYYSEELINITVERDKMKAALDKDIRDNPTKYGIGTIREEVVKNAIVIHGGEEFEMINIKTSILVAKVKALEHKKKALENLVQLYISGYNAVPKENAVKDKIGTAKKRRGV